MKRTIITAMNQERVIGKRGDLPWHYPEDMKHFKETTTGHPVIMGRKTYQSLPKDYRPLPNRINIILTRNPEKIEDHEDIKIASSLEDAWKIAEEARKDEIFVIGGEKVYEQTLEQVDRLIISKIPEKVKDADSFFPKFDKNKWSKNKTKQLNEIKVEIWERS